MVMIKIEEKDYTITDISYGEMLDMQDNATFTDDEGNARLRRGAYTRALILATVKDPEGNPVDIRNKEQCSILVARQLDSEVGKYFKTLTLKNT